VRIDSHADSEGFGTMLARSTVRDQLRGDISRDWKPEGLTIRLSVAKIALLSNERVSIWWEISAPEQVARRVRAASGQSRRSVRALITSGPPMSGHFQIATACLKGARSCIDPAREGSLLNTAYATQLARLFGLRLRYGLRRRERRHRLARRGGSRPWR